MNSSAACARQRSKRCATTCTVLRDDAVAFDQQSHDRSVDWRSRGIASTGSAVIRPGRVRPRPEPVRPASPRSSTGRGRATAKPESDERRLQVEAPVLISCKLTANATTARSTGTTFRPVWARARHMRAEGLASVYGSHVGRHESGRYCSVAPRRGSVARSETGGTTVAGLRLGRRELAEEPWAGLLGGGRAATGRFARGLTPSR